MSAMVDQNTEHLKLLSIFHYVLAAVTALFSCFPFIHVGMGIMMLSTPEFFKSTSGTPPPEGFGTMMGWMMIGMGATIILLGWLCAVLFAVAGRFLQQRKHHLFCLIVAGLECMFVPLGTILGVFSLVVLLRPEVKTLFDQNTNSSGVIQP